MLGCVLTCLLLNILKFYLFVIHLLKFEQVLLLPIGVSKTSVTCVVNNVDWADATTLENVPSGMCRECCVRCWSTLFSQTLSVWILRVNTSPLCSGSMLHRSYKSSKSPARKCLFNNCISIFLLNFPNTFTIIRVEPSENVSWGICEGPDQPTPHPRSLISAFLFANRIIGYHRMYDRGAKARMILCACAG